MSGDGRRVQRVADRVRELLTTALRRDAGDPEVSALVVTAVEVSPDLGVAKVGVRALDDRGDAALRKRLLGRVQRLAPTLRRQVGAGLALRRVPELRFFYDAGHDASARVAELLGEIAAERDAAPPSSGASPEANRPPGWSGASPEANRPPGWSGASPEANRPPGSSGASTEANRPPHESKR